MQRKGKILEILRQAESQQFMKQHKQADIRSLALQFGTKVSFNLPLVLEWIDCLQRADKKLPLHAQKECYFTRRSLEQASSEATARYKAGRIQGERLLNISGGLGIDDWSFSLEGFELVSLDPNEELNELVRENYSTMGLNRINRVNQTAEAFLSEKTCGMFDWIYADPDRREEGKRLVSLEDCAPPIKAIWTEIQAHSNRQLLKLSPLYPLEQLEKELPGLERIEVVALQGEVKEVLAFARGGETALEVPRIAIEITGDQHFEGLPIHVPSELLEDEAYFYEVHPSIAKANLGGTYAEARGTKSLLPNGIYQADTRRHYDFFGRGFEIVAKGDYSRKQFQQYLKEKKIIKANLACRYFKSTPEELKKMHKLNDGGEVYFFFFSGADGQTHFVHGKKIG